MAVREHECVWFVCGLCVVLKVKRFTKVVCSVVNLHNVF